MDDESFWDDIERRLRSIIKYVEFYTPVIPQIERLEDDGGPVYDEEEGRTRCQAISS